jgi:HD-GYP domain-containing protein (c-di-GMP phosphodiesterase class II)/HAMP domain-containing protein
MDSLPQPSPTLRAKTTWSERATGCLSAWAPISDMKLRSDEVFSLLRSRVARRMLAIFLLCAFLPICVLGGLSLWQVSRKMQSETYQRVRHASKNAGMSVLEALAIVNTELETIADSRPLRKKGEWPKRSSREALDQARLTGLTFYDEGGTPNLLFGNVCPRPILDDRMRRHLASGKALILVTQEKIASRILMAVRTGSQGSGLSLLVGEVNQVYLWDAAVRALPPAMDVSILLGSMHVLFSPLQLSQQVLATEEGGFFREHSGQFQWAGETETYLSGYWVADLGVSYLGDDWIIMASQPQSEAFSSLQRFTRLFLLTLLLMLMIVLLLSFVQIRKSLVPLARLKEGTQRVAHGDLESPVNVRSGDEFEELAQAFNSMSGNLRKQFNNLNEMGRVVRTVLTALDRTRIVEAVLDDILSVVACGWAALVLLKRNAHGEADIYCIDNTEPEAPRKFQYGCTTATDQLAVLEKTMENITEGRDGAFSSLTSSLAVRGARSFVILPIRSAQRVTGALILAYAATSAGSSEDFIRGRQLADHIASAVSNADLLNDLAQLNLGTLTALARAVDANSPWTAGHSERVTTLALQVGSAMGLSEKELDLLHQAGLLHDLGKIGVPGYILEKPGKLTDEEWAIIKEHPGKGALILEPIPAFMDVVPLVAQHHERFDGTGYPRGLEGANISLGARILAVADVFDALVSDRPYRAGWNLSEVVSFINSKADQDFDPVVVRAFLSLKLDEQDADADTAMQVFGEILRVVR